MKSIGFLLAAAIAGASFASASCPALAKGKDNWLTEGAFKRAQGHEYEDQPQNSRRRERSGGFSSDAEEYFVSDDPEVFTPGRRKYRTLDPAIAFEEEFEPTEFDNFDPEPDASIVYGKPSSPDDGFDTYEPVKLVGLADPHLASPEPSDPLSAAVFRQLRQPENAVRVTEKQRDSILNFYRQGNFRPLWVMPAGPSTRAQRVAELLAKAEEEGLSAGDYSAAASASASAGGVWNMESLARFEIGLTAMAIRYAEHLHSGRIIPNKMSGYYDVEPPVLNLGQVLHDLSFNSEPDRYLAALAPVHPAYRAMKAALAELRARDDGAGAEPVPAGARVKTGERDARVPAVRRRMVDLGFLSEEDSLAWMLGHPADTTEDPGQHELALDRKLSQALKAFQAETGLKQTGHLDESTVEALNAPADRRNEQKLVLNMERLRWLPRNLGSRHVLVNQAAFEASVVEGERPVWTTKVIVGKPETQTYVFSDQMETVVLNPYWNVPKSIIKHEMLPHLMDDPSYLDRKGFEVVDASGRVVSSDTVDWWAHGDKIPYDVRQPPGDSNALGNIKFLFPNKHDIYMHDTPTKKLFKDAVRAFSHGCVRVENPRKFAEYVLGWSRQQIDDMIATGKHREIKLEMPVPVHLTYFTAWPDETGKLVFHADIYKRDARLEKALSAVAVASN